LDGIREVLRSSGVLGYHRKITGRDGAIFRPDSDARYPIAFSVNGTNTLGFECLCVVGQCRSSNSRVPPSVIKLLVIPLPICNTLVVAFRIIDRTGNRFYTAILSSVYQRREFGR
jgi:hypothetical protein